MRKRAQTRPQNDVQTFAEAAPVIGSLGLSIRTQRKQSSLTLQDLKDRTGFSISYLSQIERNLLTPSISALRQIAEALKIPAGQLILANDGTLRPPKHSVIRQDERTRLSFPGSPITYELLTPDLRRRVSLMWVKAPPGAESGPAFTHEGEDGVVVVKGEIEIEFASVWHRLAVGDSMYFNADVPHRWRNSSRATAEVIWLSTPPAF